MLILYYSRRLPVKAARRVREHNSCVRRSYGAMLDDNDDDDDDAFVVVFVVAIV